MPRPQKSKPAGPVVANPDLISNLSFRSSPPCAPVSNLDPAPSRQISKLPCALGARGNSAACLGVLPELKCSAFLLAVSG